jgi:hypothetical protein
MEIDPQTQARNLFINDRLVDQEIIRADVFDNDTFSFDGNKLVEILISFSIGIASGVVGNIIYNAIHSAAKKLEINGRRTRLTEESITQAIETIKMLCNERDVEKDKIKTSKKDTSQSD